MTGLIMSGGKPTGPLGFGSRTASGAAAIPFNHVFRTSLMD